MTAKRSLFLTFFLILILTGVTVHSRELSVFSFDFNPLIFRNSSNQVQGINADLLERIAEENDWRIAYVHGTWNDGLNLGRDGKVDVLTSVMFTEERNTYLDYSKESVFTVWGEVYTRTGSSTDSLIGLKKSTIAIMRGDLSGKNFQHLADSFDLACRYVEVGSHHDVFRLVAEGAVDAGVAPNIFGLLNAERYELTTSSIVFSPNPLFFAVPKGTNANVLEAIDRSLQAWKEDESSYYYQVLDRWLLGPRSGSFHVPSWLYSVLLIACLLLVFSAYTIKVLRKIIDNKTRALQRSESRFKNFFIASGVGLIVFDDSSKIIEVNKKTQELTGKNKDLLVGSDLAAVFDSPGLERISRLLDSGDVRNSDFEATIKTIDNQVRNVEVGLHEISMEDARFFLVELQDITERKKAEERIREHIEILDKITASAKDAIVQIDADGNISFWNAAAQRIFGYPAGDVIGNNVHLLLAPQSELGSIEQAFHHFRQTGRGRALGQTLELEAVHKDGHLIAVELSLSTFIHDHKTHALAIIRDISERKQAEKQQKEMEVQLRQKYKMEAVGVMAGGIAHNFNNNLAIMLGNLELAQKYKNNNQKWQRYLDNTFVAIKRSKDLVEKIMAYSRQDVNGTKLVQPAQIVRESTQLLRAVIPTTVDILYEDMKGSEGLIDVDATQLQEALINLCANAVHAMGEKGTIRFLLDTIHLEGKDLAPGFICQQGDYVRIRVVDTGAGMSEETMQKIFDPFFTTKEVGVGTGMGLATVLGFVRSCSGMITVDSALGQGSTFSLFFPLIAEPRADREPKVLKGGDNRGDEHILLVDDEEMLVELTCQMLVDAGYRVTVETDGREALDKFKASPNAFDLVLTDQTMPHMTGLELIAEIKKFREDLPCLLITGYSSEPYQESAKYKGVDAFCAKPLEMESLLGTIRSVLDQS